MIEDQINQHADASLLRGVCEFDEISKRTVAWVYAIIVCNIITIIAKRRDLKRHQPDGGHA
jgi:hypothetical protein